MTKTLYIRLLPQADALEWVLINDQGRPALGPSSEFVDTLAEQVKGAKVIVIVPGVDVVLTSVNVPKMTHTRLMQAIPNLLEEDIAQSPEQIHFAVGKFEADQPLLVAIVAKQKMHSWVSLLKDKTSGLALEFDAFVPDILCLPWSENQWTAVLDDNHVIVRTGEFSGFTTERSLFSFLTKRLLDEAEFSPDALHIYGNSDDQNWNGFDVSINQHQRPDSILVSFAEQLRSDVLINLLQGEFERNHKYKVTQKLVKVAAIMIAVWVCMLTAIDITKYFYLQSHVSDIKQEIATVYKEIFPKSTSVVSPKARIERLLKDAQVAGSSDFIKLLTQVAPVLEKSKGIKPAELQFEKGQMELKVEASDFDLLDQFIRNLKTTGLNVEQLGAVKSGGTIESKVKVQL